MKARKGPLSKSDLALLCAILDKRNVALEVRRVQAEFSVTQAVFDDLKAVLKLTGATVKEGHWPAVV